MGIHYKYNIIYFFRIENTIYLNILLIFISVLNVTKNDKRIEWNIVSQADSAFQLKYLAQ